jgi:hypothetical protein
MADAAFKTASYPGYTTVQLTEFIAAGRDATGRMAEEVARRAKRDAGDVSVMTDGERLRRANLDLNSPAA